MTCRTFSSTKVKIGKANYSYYSGVENEWDDMEVRLTNGRSVDAELSSQQQEGLPQDVHIHLHNSGQRRWSGLGKEKIPAGQTTF